MPVLEVAPEKKEIASESGHWYDGVTGEPRYTIIGKNGKERPTTLRDARAEGFVPSVTTILQILPKPFLSKWLQRQVLMSALTLPRLGEESDDSYIVRIMADADEQSRKAREKGTAIHGYIEKWLINETIAPEAHIYVNGALNALADYLQAGDNFYLQCEPEKSFSRLGYGGKVDLHSKSLNFVCDFKTKEFTEDDTIPIYTEHSAQLAAYANGLGIPDARLINVFISTTVPGLAKVVEHTDNTQAWQIFLDCLTLWRRLKKF